MTERILIIEDDENLASGLEYNLRRAGYEVAMVSTGVDGLRRLEGEAFDLVLLDLMLPGMSGFDVLENLRERGCATPVLILSARDAEVDKVRGFDLGAVDYVAKPFGIGELLARIRTRLGESASRSGETLTLEAGTVNLDAMTFEGSTETENLTPLEVEILRELARGRGHPVERDALSRSIWGLGAGATRSLDTHISRLRKKIERDPARPRHLQTVHGVGYRLVL